MKKSQVPYQMVEGQGSSEKNLPNQIMKNNLIYILCQENVTNQLIAI